MHIENLISKKQDPSSCLETKCPSVATEWHPTKNGELTPAMVSAGSSKKVWWLGPCGHEWEASISNRAKNNTRCPYCSRKKVLPGFNDLATKRPDLAEEWYQPRNGKLRPQNVMPGSNLKAYWKCKTCGLVWGTLIVNRGLQNSGCPSCTKRKPRKK